MFEKLLARLRATGIPFAAYRWDIRPATSYGTLQLEGGADSVAGDDMILTQGIRGSIDLYATDASTAWPRTVQDAINGYVAWRLNSVQYEDDTRLVHYEWVFEAVGL